MEGGSDSPEVSKHGNYGWFAIMGFAVKFAFKTHTQIASD